MKRLSGGLVLAMITMYPATFFGQSKVLTLSEAKAMALERNLSVVQADNNVSSAQGSVLAAYGSYLPTLSASATAERYQSQRPASQPVYFNGIPISSGSSGLTVQNQFTTNVSVNYLLFDGLNREGQFNRAKMNAVSTEHVGQRTRQSVIYQVESDYLNVLRNQQLVSVNEENLKRDNRQLERIVESNKVGAAAIADVYRQQSTVAADELAVITAQNNYDGAKADLLALVGLNAGEDYTITDSTVSTVVTKADIDSTTKAYSDIAALSQRAMDARPDYLSANEQLSAAESGVTSARSGYFPSISAFAGWGLGPATELNTIGDYRGLNWGLQLRWNLFDAFQTNQSLQSALTQQRNAQVNLSQTQLNIMVDVKKALLNLDAARKQYQVSQDGVRSATEDRKIAEEKYNLGAGTLLDLLTASANLVNAQANLVNASYNYLISKKNVEYVIGEHQY
ncbi:MAG TPA: TolC family protein [Bacteroidota bacterium]|nr:TolC family protein [Bacteroidota bacterium]